MFIFVEKRKRLTVRNLEHLKILWIVSITTNIMNCKIRLGNRWQKLFFSFSFMFTVTMQSNLNENQIFLSLASNHYHYRNANIKYIADYDDITSDTDKRDCHYEVSILHK